MAVSYSDKDVQEAYLLRYFVPYSYLLPTLLKNLESQGTIVSCDDGLLSACFFGCGPGPELAGLIRHLSQKSFRPDMVVAHMFDAASDTWAHGRSIFTNSVLAAEWDPALI